MQKMYTVDVTLKSNNLELVMPRYSFEHILGCMGFTVRDCRSNKADSEDIISGIAKINRAINLNYGCEFTCDETVVKIDNQEVTFPKITLGDLKMTLAEIKQFALKSKNTISW